MPVAIQSENLPTLARLLALLWLSTALVQGLRAQGANQAAGGYSQASRLDTRPLSPEPDPGVPRHFLYLEAAGNSGDRLSLNYEMAIWRREKVTFTARTGIFYYQERSLPPLKVQREAGDMIFGIHTIYAASTRHRLETGLGVNIRWQKIEGITDYLSSNLATASIGYRMLPKDGRGLMLRANLLLIHNADYNWLEYYLEGQQRQTPLLPWAGVSIGYAF
jgi:hypothetical protein